MMVYDKEDWVGHRKEAYAEWCTKQETLLLHMKYELHRIVGEIGVWKKRLDFKFCIEFRIENNI